MPRKLRVGELAGATGKTARAIRLYEEMGLIGSAGRTEGRYRIFDESALERMRWISDLQAFGLSLTQIRELIGELDRIDVGREAHKRVRALYRERLGRVRKTMRALRGLESELERSLDYLDVCRTCDAPKPKEACVDCSRERPVEKPALVKGLHADTGWVRTMRIFGRGAPAGTDRRDPEDLRDR